jgi:hypothetical protein
MEGGGVGSGVPHGGGRRREGGLVPTGGTQRERRGNGPVVARVGGVAHPHWGEREGRGEA